jgi:hypothetical protein
VLRGLVAGEVWFEAPVRIAGGSRITARALARRKLEGKVRSATLAIDWRAELAGQIYDAGRTGPHAIHQTFGAPNESSAEQEDGATLLRMRHAIELVARARGQRPHEVVASLMALFPGYTLMPDPAVPKELDHPAYFNDRGGAWPMADHIAARAECQAIVRFVRAILRQTGCPGETSAVVVWSDPEIDGGATALEREIGMGGGLATRNKRGPSGGTWYAALVDRPLSDGDVGKVFPPSHARLPDGRRSLGFNNFEACLRFRDGGVCKYYGGGAGVYGSPQEVLRCFHALCWMSPARTGGEWGEALRGARGWRIEQIVRRYR